MPPNLGLTATEYPPPPPPSVPIHPPVPPFPCTASSSSVLTRDSSILSALFPPIFPPPPPSLLSRFSPILFSLVAHGKPLLLIELSGFLLIWQRQRITSKSITRIPEGTARNMKTSTMRLQTNHTELRLGIDCRIPQYLTLGL